MLIFINIVCLIFAVLGIILSIFLLAILIAGLATKALTPDDRKRGVLALCMAIGITILIFFTMGIFNSLPRNCPACGSEVKLGSSYCATCETDFCPTCGEEVGTPYCGNCGTQVIPR